MTITLTATAVIALVITILLALILAFLLGILVAVKIMARVTGSDKVDRETTNDNRCVCCGAIIPEGRLVCPNCE